MTAIIKNDLFKIALYFVMTIVVGAALAPGLFYAGKWLAASGYLHESSIKAVRELGRILEETNFQRYFNRALLLSALLCLIPLLASMRLFKRGALGLQKNPSRLSDVTGGFALAAGLLLFTGWMLVLAHVFEPRLPEQRDSLVAIFRTAIIAGVAVGLLEEFLFRGLMLGVCVRAAGRTTALIFVSVIFAVVHFLKPPDTLVIEDASVNWITGFWLVGKCFEPLADPMAFAAEFLTLLMVAWVLGVARLRTGSLWVSIGLHAGWVFGLKSFSALTWRAAELSETAPWVGKDLKSGVLIVAVVGLTGWLTTLWLRESHGQQLGA